MIYLPRSKAFVVTLNVCGPALFLIKSECLSKPLSDATVLLSLCAWIAAFLASITHICISKNKIEIRICHIPIRRIAANKLLRIEIILWQNITHVVFEMGKCPRFREDGSIDSLSVFLFLNMFRTIEYIPPTAQEDAVLELLNLTFPGKVSIVEKDY